MNKTFAELGYNVGDTVRCVDNGRNKHYVIGHVYLLNRNTYGQPKTNDGGNGHSGEWKLVSRAGSTVDTDDECPTWSDMTPEAQGALLLAFHNGAGIQLFKRGSVKWYDMSEKPSWVDHMKYRVKPADPVVVTHELFGRHKLFWSGACVEPDTHRLTYNMIDGVIDCASIQMMEIDK